MRRLLLVVLLSSFAGSALALFPVRTDWEQNHLQGKVKSVESYSEDNPEAIEEGDPLTNYKKSFYNAQGFLVKEEERDTEESYNQSTRFHTYHYDDKNRLIERNSEEVVLSTENKDDTAPSYFGALYQYQENDDGTGIQKEFIYAYKKPTSPNWEDGHHQMIYDAKGNLLKDQMYYPKTNNANQVLIYFYDDARLSKVCDISEKEKIEDCETYRYFDDGSFVKNGSFNDLRVEITYDKNHHEIKRQFIDKDGRVSNESYKTKHRFDEQGNVIESVMYNEKGEWVTKTTYKYEYY